MKLSLYHVYHIKNMMKQKDKDKDKDQDKDQEKISDNQDKKII